MRALVSTGLATLLVSQACQEPQPAAPAKALPVAGGRIELTSGYDVAYELIGVVRGARESAVGFELSGKVADIRVAEGDAVEKGQVLAALSSSRIRVQREQAIAAKRNAEAQLGLAMASQRRAEALLRERLTTEQEHDERQFSLDAQRASMQSANATLEEVDVLLSQTMLRAPFAGTVTKKLLSEGTVVAAGQPVLWLHGSDEAEIVVGLPPKLANQFPVDSVVSLSLEDGGAVATNPDDSTRTVPGRVLNIVQQVSEATRSLSLIVRVEGASAPPPGSVVRLTHREHHPGSGAWVPWSALQPGTRGLFRLFRLTLEESATPQFARAEGEVVQVVHAQGDRAYVEGTLASGGLVVVEGAHRVSDGQRVEVLPPDDSVGSLGAASDGRSNP